MAPRRGPSRPRIGREFLIALLKERAVTRRIEIECPETDEQALDMAGLADSATRQRAAAHRQACPACADTWRLWREYEDDPLLQRAASEGQPDLLAAEVQHSPPGRQPLRERIRESAAAAARAFCMPRYALAAGAILALVTGFSIWWATRPDGSATKPTRSELFALVEPHTKAVCRQHAVDAAQSSGLAFSGTVSTHSFALGFVLGLLSDAREAGLRVPHGPADPALDAQLSALSLSLTGESRPASQREKIRQIGQRECSARGEADNPRAEICARGLDTYRLIRDLLDARGDAAQASALLQSPAARELRRWAKARLASGGLPSPAREALARVERCVSEAPPQVSQGIAAWKAFASAMMGL